MHSASFPKAHKHTFHLFPHARRPLPVIPFTILTQTHASQQLLQMLQRRKGELRESLLHSQSAPFKTSIPLRNSLDKKFSPSSSSSSGKQNFVPATAKKEEPFAPSLFHFAAKFFPFLEIAIFPWPNRREGDCSRITDCKNQQPFVS